MVSAPAAFLRHLAVLAGRQGRRDIQQVGFVARCYRTALVAAVSQYHSLWSMVPIFPIRRPNAMKEQP